MIYIIVILSIHYVAFENNEDAKRILREIILMRRLNHENIIRMLDLIPPHQDATDFEEIYIVQVSLYIKKTPTTLSVFSLILCRT